MKIGLFGKTFNDSFNCIIHNLLLKLFERDIEIFIYKPFFTFLVEEKKFTFNFSGFFESHQDLPKDIDLMVIIGGDGTFLEAITIVRDSKIPIVGFNSGRLGFLTNIAANEAEQAIAYLIAKQYSIEDRSLLEFNSSIPLFGDFPFALNECTIQKTSSSLTTIHVSMNGEYLNSYWADGLIIATPTGSTAYSLSVGGPIVTPQSKNFIITPIAGHNLNVRPLVLPDDSTLTLKVEGRTENFLATLDSRSSICNIINQIEIKKSKFPVCVVKFPHINFCTTLRNKLMWGADKRN